MATEKRILEYALKGLEAERDVILAEIAALRARLGGRVAKKRRARAVKGVRREAAKAVSKAATSAKKKARKMTAAQKKALSKKMKAAWARRKAGK